MLPESATLCCSSGWTRAKERSGRLKSPTSTATGLTASMLLVTGGAGFIGSNVVASLNEAGRSDIAVNDILGSDGKWRNLANRQIADFVPPADAFALARRPQARGGGAYGRHFLDHRDRRRRRHGKQFPAVARACWTGARRRARRSSMPRRPRPSATAKKAFPTTGRSAPSNSSSR